MGTRKSELQIKKRGHHEPSPPFLKLVVVCIFTIIFANEFVLILPAFCFISGKTAIFFKCCAFIIVFTHADMKRSVVETAVPVDHA